MHKTGATRYQKFLKSEKSKTKLKAKQDLPKGTNVTKTNFKVKKIVIKEQLTKHSQKEALSSRKLNTKELLSRLSHFNTKVQTDALDGLRELITSHPEVLEHNLSYLINGVNPLILNIEKQVRKESLKLLHLILSNVTLEKIEPFFDIMSTYLRSAMTHIDNRIQEDSLLFLDVILLCVPKKAIEDFHKIIPNFLDMISKLRLDAKPGRTLTVDLNSQTTSVRWRVKVFNRLQDYLQKFAEHNQIRYIEKHAPKSVAIFDDSKLNYYPLFNPIYTSVSQVSIFSSKSAQNTQIDEVEMFKTYIETLMPLLFETWLEACPNIKSERNIETVINEEAAILLKHMVDVISLFWDFIKYLNIKYPSSNIKDSFYKKYKAEFSKHFVTALPYVTNIRSKQINSDSFECVLKDPKLVIQNLLICDLFVAFNPNINIKTQKSEINNVLSYIEKIFNEKCQDDINKSVMNILRTIFCNEITGWTKTVTVLDALFRKILWVYFNKNLPDTHKQEIFALLCEIALNDKLSHFHSSVAFEKWLNNLPDILLGDSITIQTIDIIHKFAVTNNKTFNTIVKPKLQDIVNNLPTIKVTDSTNDTHFHKLFSLLYWIKVWDTGTLNLLEKQLIDSTYEKDYGKYIFDTLRLRIADIIL